ncbi:MAG: carboxypeptidase regulatory-like domain-containing protein, partial [Candidatus Binataceae bacterium]
MHKAFCVQEFHMRVYALVFAGISIFLISVAGSAAYAGVAEQPARPLTGTVQDTLGRPISGAEVSLRAPDGREVAKTRTNKTGRFAFGAVAPGNYAVLANKKGFTPATAIIRLPGASAKPIQLAMESEQALSLPVIAKRIEKARNSLSPTTGGSEYRFSQKTLQQLPQGNNTQLNQVLLQAPGVVQDSYGQLHVRGDHANLLYAINGVQLPEGITGFGQILSPRFAQNISLLTGALPAEYGLRTAGIVNIQTKTGFSLQGGDVDFYGGQRGTLQPSFQLGGSKGNFDYFVTGQYVR